MTSENYFFLSNKDPPGDMGMQSLKDWKDLRGENTVLNGGLGEGDRRQGEEAKAWMTARLLVVASGGWRCWSPETRTLERGGKGGGGVHSHVGAPYLTDEETEECSISAEVTIFLSSGVSCPRGGGVPTAFSPGSGSSAASTIKSCWLLNVSCTTWNNT